MRRIVDIILAFLVLGWDVASQLRVSSEQSKDESLATDSTAAKCLNQLNISSEPLL